MLIDLAKDRIISMEIKEAAESLLRPEANGIHCLLIYHDLNTCREFYSYYLHESIDKNDEIIQIAPFYETEDSVRYTLTHSQHNRIMDLDGLEKGNYKRLAIIDSLEKYLSPSNAMYDYENIQDLVKSAKKLGLKRATILGDSGAFFYKKKIPQLIEYELSLPTHFEFDMKGICLYHQKDFDTLPNDKKQKLVNHHELAIRI